MRKYALWNFLFCLSIILNILHPFTIISANAQEEVDPLDYSSLLLNEIMPDPEGSDTDYEWVELHNSGEEADLSGCTIDDKQFPSSTMIKADGFLVIAKDLLDKDSDGQSFEIRWGNGSKVWGDDEREIYSAIQLAISMSNSNDSISLVCQDYTDTFEWQETISGQSFSFDENGEWTSEYLVTPGYENQPVPEAVYSHDILISEVYPSPRGELEEGEWIELYNFGTCDIDLLNWQLEDNTKTQTFKESLIVKTGEYLILDDDYLEITLNNSGETLTFYDPNGDVVDIFEYEETQSGVSNIRLLENGTYTEEIYQTQVVTQGSENEFVDIEDVFYGVEVFSIQNARARDFGEDVCVQGVITVEMNLLGSKLFYIQDKTGGIQVYFSDDEYWQDFKIGDEIKILGELKETKGESRIYVNDPNAVSKISSGSNTPKLPLKTGKVGEELEGRLIVVTGEIVKTSGRSFYIDDGSGQIKILLKTSTGIETPKKKKGQYAGVVGIVSQYGEDSEGTPSYRVLPRYSSDIVISDEPLSYGDVLAATGQSTVTLQWFGLIICCLMLKLFFNIKQVRSIADNRTNKN